MRAFDGVDQPPQHARIERRLSVKELVERCVVDVDDAHIDGCAHAAHDAEGVTAEIREWREQAGMFEQQAEDREADDPWRCVEEFLAQDGGRWNDALPERTLHGCQAGSAMAITRSRTSVAAAAALAGEGVHARVAATA